MQRLLSALTLGVTIGFCGPALADQVGKVGVDWTGNDIVVEAIKDPAVDGVTCHVSYFDRGIIDRLHKANWFEDPSDSSIDCRQTGPISIGDIELGEGGEEVFKQGIRGRAIDASAVHAVTVADVGNGSLCLPLTLAGVARASGAGCAAGSAPLAA
jgi:hypothetical protein